jgi:hypothetical protein
LSKDCKCDSADDDYAVDPYSIIGFIAPEYTVFDVFLCVYPTTARYSYLSLDE